MRTYESLRRRGDFARVRSRGKRYSGSFLTCFVAAGRRRTRVGIAIAVAVGGAVVRNRLRRRIKAILDLRGAGAPPYRDVLFVARPGSGELRFAELAGEIERILGRAA
ncbi:MAG TPA: ribonuclease P protein component [Candidatus Baltobacteraceae bacterium]|nr:ribonuclease P protein component [Candidatus Baltobacteraceae bacterium]